MADARKHVPCIAYVVCIKLPVAGRERDDGAMTGNSPYLLRGGPDEPACVELWSSVRVPFEPRAWVREMRDDLREAVRRLVARPGRLLHATYSSLEDDFVDTENVLIYNVGPAHLGSAARYGLRFDTLRDSAGA